jgi:spermidine synthase
MSRPLRVLFGACFFLSGGAGLVYQVVWGRRLTTFFGSTTEGVSVVLAVFMAGLGAGAFLLGRRADRAADPGRLYGVLEILVGLYGAVSLPLLSVVGAGFLRAGSGLPPGAALTALKASAAVLVLFVPCFLMGGTLPALARAYVRAGEGATRALGTLYALNLAGAVSGTLLAGFVLVESAGLIGTTLAAAAANLFAGGAVLAARARKAPGRPDEPDREPGDAPGSLAGKLIPAGLFLSGALLFAAEVVFTRVLAIAFGVSTYAFAIILAIFLLGLGLGAGALARLSRRGLAPLAAFALAQTGLAAAVAFSLVATIAVPRILLTLRQVPEAGFLEVLCGKAFLAAAIILPAAILGGIGTPALLAALARERATLGRRVGDGYLANCAGTVVGALATGFVAIPVLGTEGTLKAIAALAAGTGLAALGAVSLRVRWAAAALALVALSGTVAGPAWPVWLFLNADVGGRVPVSTTRREFEERLRAAPNEVLAFREGREATVAVVQTPRTRSLIVNGHPDASDTDDMATQLMLAVLPLGLHPRPVDVLVIGYGIGVSAAAALRVPGVRRVDIVEIEPAVLAVAPLFAHVNGGVEKDPRVTVALDDARSFVGRTARTWDVVISEPSNPWRAGVASLYSADFFRDLKRRLNPGGLLAQWMHLYDLDAETLRIVFRTLAASFADVNVWWLDQGNVVILASDTPLVLRSERLRALLDGPFRSDRTRWAHLESADEVWGRLLLDRSGLLAFLSQNDPVHDDDRPVLEYRAARATFRPDPLIAERLLARKLERGVALSALQGPEPPEDERWLGVAEMYEEAGRRKEAAAAILRAAATPSPLARVRLAELAMAERRLNEAGKILAAAAPAARTGPPDLARAFAYAEARLAAREGDVERARAAWSRTGEIEGPAGLELLSVYMASGRGTDALELARRLLSAARPGGPIGPPEVEIVYHYLREAASSPERLAEAIRIAGSVPDLSRGLPRLARERLLAELYERSDRPEDALAACTRAGETGVFDVELLGIRARALRALGRAEEAAAVEERLRAVAPGLMVRPVRSPLIDTGAAAPAGAPGAGRR